MGLDCPARMGSAARSHRLGAMPLTPEVIARTESQLQELYGDRVSVMVLPGNPITEIRRYARNKKMDLICIGNQALAVETVYGQRLTEDAPCPVIVFFAPKPFNDAPKSSGE